MLQCPKCGSLTVLKKGIENNGKQKIHCKNCHRSSRLTITQIPKQQTLCLNCGSESAHIGNYQNYGLTYSCKKCHSCAVIEKKRLNPAVKNPLEMYKQLRNIPLNNMQIMRKLRNHIFAKGKTIILPLKKTILFVPAFDKITFPNQLVGNASKLLEFLLNTTKLNLTQLSEQSGINQQQLDSLLRRKQTPNQFISKELELATHISAHIWSPTKQKIVKSQFIKKQKKKSSVSK